MGMLINGIWKSEVNNKAIKRMDKFRSFISQDGSSGFKAEARRYHLYVSLACPWASRTVIFRKLKKLENIISMSIVDPLMEENGWVFSNNEGCVPDIINHFDFLYQIYTKAKPDYTGRVTVPVLWDQKTQTIVNNESSQIIRMLNSEFNEFSENNNDFYPKTLRNEIDKINDRVFNFINSGVYKAGFADNQSDYEAAFDALFSELEAIEKQLSKTRYLVGDQLTEADWRLFTTLVRFDAVYYIHFKCNLYRIIDYPNMFNYLLELYQYPGIADTVNFDHIKKHYYMSHRHINPKRIIPKGPAIDLTVPYKRQEISSQDENSFP
jgi:putative glutathione S-transferase